MRFYTHRHKYYCGIDLHARVMYLCITDAEGSVLVHKNLRTDPAAFERTIKPYREDLAVAVGCVFVWYWFAARQSFSVISRTPAISTICQRLRRRSAGRSTERESPITSTTPWWRPASGSTRTCSTRCTSRSCLSNARSKSRLGIMIQGLRSYFRQSLGSERRLGSPEADIQRSGLPVPS